LKKRRVHPTVNQREIGVQKHILYTKLQRPPVAPDILQRPRLLDRLNEGRHRTLTLISAPAGYGKSTLASRWVAACDSPSGWVSLDETDTDLRTFLSYVLAAVRSLSPKTQFRTEALLEASQLPSASVLAHHLLNDLHQIAEPFILVLDDYHHIRGESSVHDLLTEILAHPPKAMHLVLLTRRDPAFPLATMGGRGQVTEIRAGDLRFTPAEAAAFLKKKLRIPLDDATAALLDKKTEGWVTGLRLAGLYLRDQDDLKHRVRELRGSSLHITEYLVSEVLSRQNADIAAFLVETSILDRFCAPLCQAVHLRGAERRNGEQAFEAQGFIDWLVEANIFVIPLDDQGYWFRYHHLFQEFLQAMLRKQSNADAVAGLHMRASNWFAENGLIEEAIRHALAAQDAQAAVRLVVEHRYDLLNTSQFSRLSEWLRFLPEEAVLKNPLLLTTQAFMGLVFNPETDIYTYTELARRMAVTLSADSPDSLMFNGEIAVLQSVQDVILGRAATAIANAKKALQLLPRQTFYFRSLAIGAMAAGHQMEGDCSRGAKLMRDSLADPDWPVGIRAKMWLYLCIISFMDANTSAAVFSGRECLKIGGSTQFIHPKNNTRFFLGAIHYMRNELAEAKNYLKNIMKDREVSEPCPVVQASGILGFIHMAEGCPEEANRIIESISLDSWNMQDGYALSTREALPVELALRQGRVDEARRLSVGIDFDVSPPYWFPIVPQLTRIKLLLAEGADKSLKEAHIQLAELDEQMGRIHRKNVRIDVLALLALICHKSGEETAALEKLRAALALAEPGGWIRNFVDLGAPMRDLLERLIQVQPEHQYAQQVLAACNTAVQSNEPSGPDAEKRSGLSGKATVPILTQREIEILPLLAEGLSNKQIAAKLFVAQVTVKTHLQNIYRKLNARGRIETLKKASELGLITSD